MHFFADEFSRDLSKTLQGLHSTSLVTPQHDLSLAHTIFSPSNDCLFEPAFIQRALTSHLQVMEGGRVRGEGGVE